MGTSVPTKESLKALLSQFIRSPNLHSTVHKEELKRNGLVSDVIPSNISEETSDTDEFSIGAYWNDSNSIFRQTIVVSKDDSSSTFTARIKMYLCTNEVEKQLFSTEQELTELLNKVSNLTTCQGESETNFSLKCLNKYGRLFFLQSYGDEVVIRSRKCSILDQQENLVVSTHSERIVCKECFNFSERLQRRKSLIRTNKSLLKTNVTAHNQLPLVPRSQLSDIKQEFTNLQIPEQIINPEIPILEQPYLDENVDDQMKDGVILNDHNSTCSICSMTGFSLDQYNLHLHDCHRMGENDGKLTCLECKKPWSTTLRNPSCNFICKCTKTRDSFKRNRDNNSVKTTKKSETDYYRWRHKRKRCFYCPLEFMSMTDYMLHIEVAHQNEDIRHMSEKINKMTNLEELNWFKAVESDQNINHKVSQLDGAKDTQKTNNALQVNKVDENLPMSRKCEFCPQVFSHFGILLRHYKSVHDDKQFSLIQDRSVLLYISLINRLPNELVMCDVCGKKFSRDRLRTHQTIHNPKAKECPVCKEMVLVNSWSSHKLKHLKGTFTYLCSLCGASFDSPNVYRGHLRIHTKDREHRFQCSEPGCESKFLWKKGLIRHVKKAHLKLIEDKVCKICNKRNANMSKHMLTHMNEKRFSCSVCGHKTKRIDNIKTHMKRHGDLGKVLLSVEGDTHVSQSKQICDQPHVIPVS